MGERLTRLPSGAARILESLRAAETERDALARRVEDLRAALTEITSPPDANGPHEDYGTLDLDEAREIAKCALCDDYGWHMSPPAADDAARGEG